MRLFWFIIAVLLTLPLSAQRKDQLERAQREFAAGDYPSAIRTLQGVKKLEEDAEASLLLAVSQFNANDLLSAEAGLVTLLEREKDDYPLAWFYLGRVYHAQHRFKRAATEYKRYLRMLNNDGPERKTVVRLLRNVDNGIRAGFVSDEMIAENMGQQVNSEHDEYGPIPSPSGNGKLYFSLLHPDLVDGTLHSDIVVTEPNDLGWGDPSPLNPLLNTNAQEFLADISPDGQQLFYYRGGDERDGRYLMDTYREGNDQLVTVPAAGAGGPAGGGGGGG
ncbi:MAG: tetratricopeptide repeat protein, partial [Bacteroidota bacterium]